MTCAEVAARWACFPILAGGCDGTSDHNLDGSGDGGGAVPDGQTGVKVADGTAPFEMTVNATTAPTWEAKALNPSVT